MSLAIIFPGQGSQSLGMLSALAESFPVVRATYEEASQALGFDLWRLTQDGPETELNRTEHTQPALLAAGRAIWRVWNESGGEQPGMFAGHSLGEYTALVCAGVIDFSDAITLVADRGKYMQEAVPQGTGAMAAILGLDDEQVVEVCQAITGEQIVSAANFNATGQVVIAGHAGAVQQAMEAAKQAGAKRAILLPVSVPSHCALMTQAADRLATRLESLTFSTANIPVIQNVDVEQHTATEGIKQALIQQLYQPVRWVETVHKMQNNGVTQLVECGPGKVLTGLVKRIDRNLNALAVYDPSSLQAAIDKEQR